jgi:hypothetical protein
MPDEARSRRSRLLASARNLICRRSAPIVIQTTASSSPDGVIAQPADVSTTAGEVNHSLVTSSVAASVEPAPSVSATGHQTPTTATSDTTAPKTPADAVLEPARETCWEKAIVELKTVNLAVFTKLENMEKKIKEKEAGFIVKDPPDLLKIAESKKRKAKEIPRWLQGVIRGILQVKDILALVAAFDPHKAAPLALKGICFILEVRIA